MKRLLYILAFVWMPLAALADDANLRASAPRTVEAGRNFRVQFTANSQNVSHFTAPDFKGFEVLYGPSTSSQTSIQMINGRTTQNSSVIYTYTLHATEPGTFTIGAATVQSEGKTIRSNSLSVRVLPAGDAGDEQASGTQSSRPAASQSASRNDLFMTATASRTKVSEQEAILLTYKVYTLVDLTQLEGKLPTLDGFQIQELPQSRNKEFDIEQYGGRNYRTVVWSQYLLFPQSTGKLTIPSVSFEGVVVTRNTPVDPIEAFFSGRGGLVETRRRITAPALTIQVSPLPDRPEGFSGGVGKFSVSSEISASEVKANDAVTLKLTVKGSGNMKLLTAPALRLDPTFETFDTKVQDHFTPGAAGLTGEKKFEYLFVPRHAGSYEIPAIQFVYFDTATRTYKTASTQPYTLKVTASKDGGSGQVSDFGGHQQDVRQLNLDIRHIKRGAASVRSSESTFFGRWPHLLGFIIPLTLFAILVILGRMRMARNADTAKVRGRKADKVAMKRLKKARALLDKKDATFFYEEVLRALWGYVCDKLNMPRESLNKDNIRQELSRRQISEERVDELIKLIDNCEFARYAPGGADAGMEAVYNNACEVIRKIEQNTSPRAGRGLATMIIWGAFVLTAFAADPQTLKSQADSLYDAQKYAEAAQLYSTLLHEQGSSPEAYFNLGNCHYKMGDIPLAVLNYERAWKLDPADEDIRANLALARGKTADRYTPPSEAFFVLWWRELTYWLSPDGWAVTGVCAFALMLAGVFVWLATSSPTLRKAGFYGAVIMLVLAVLTHLAAITRHTQDAARPFAVILAPSVTVKSSPSNTGVDLFVIHAGSKVEILDSDMKDWAEVKFEEGKQGWVPVKSFETI